MDVAPTPGSGPLAGLCESCLHARYIATARGSVFLLCERSRGDARFARYPRLPVDVCDGFEPRKDRGVTRA
jgi:hypothetical protein